VTCTFGGITDEVTGSRESVGLPKTLADVFVKWFHRRVERRGGLMNDFEALIQSLGEHIIEYLKAARVSRVRIFPDANSESAHIEICLSDHSWSAQSSAIDKMIEIRAIFLDDIAFDYAFVDEDQCGSDSAASRSADFVAA
jgi:hypothetical protein